MITGSNLALRYKMNSALPMTTMSRDENEHDVSRSVGSFNRYRWSSPANHHICSLD
jgi:hypothetical protein